MRDCSCTNHASVIPHGVPCGRPAFPTPTDPLRLQTLAFLFATAPALQAQENPLPTIGEAAPTFTVKDHTGADTTVGGKSDTWTVLAFYPKALTGG